MTEEARVDKVQLTTAQETGIRALVKMREEIELQFKEVLSAIGEHVRMYARAQGLPPGEYNVSQEGEALFLVAREVASDEELDDEEAGQEG